MNDSSLTFLMRSGQPGGVELRVFRGADWFQKEGWRVRIAATRFSGFEHFQALAAVEEFAVSALRFPLFMEEWRWRHIQRVRAGLRAIQLKKFAADVVHVPFAWTEQGLSTLWLAGCVAESVVISVHNVFPKWQVIAWHHRQMRAVFSKVVGIYGVSAGATNAFLGIFSRLISSEAEVRSIPNFVDCGRFTPDEEGRRMIRQTLTIPDDALVIAVLGRISEQKQPAVVVEAFAKLSTQCSDRNLRLLFIGGGELEETLWRQAREAGVDHRIQVTGFVDNPQKYLAAADVHLLASIREGFGIATIEAMACGIPVVATDTKASSEILEGKYGAILVEQGDPARIAEVLRALLFGHSERAWRGRQARAKVLACYGKSQWMEKMRLFYAAALGSHA